jgi:hypothetical protein
MKSSLPDPKTILQQIAAIATMETGKLSAYVPTGRPAATTPYFKLQSWQEGKNVTRHVRSERLPQLQAALEGYAQFCQLCEQYADLVVQRTRRAWETDAKKKPIQPYTRRSPKSSR